MKVYGVPRGGEKGGKQWIVVNSGCNRNQKPTTDRGIRRAKARAEAKIQKRVVAA